MNGFIVYENSPLMEKQKGKRVCSKLSASLPWPHCLFDLSSLPVFTLLRDLPLAVPLEYPFTLFRNIIFKKAGAESENHHLFDVAMSRSFETLNLLRAMKRTRSLNPQVFLGLGHAPGWWSSRPGMREGGSRSAAGSCSPACTQRENTTAENRALS